MNGTVNIYGLNGEQKDQLISKAKISGGNGMGRKLKRVPMDFNYPLNRVWYGYYDKYPRFCHEEYSAGCEGCKAYAKIKGVEIKVYSDGSEGCPDYNKYYGIPECLEDKVEPPEGEGYQLWETTSEGSPVSPVFGTLEKLCEWCEKNATTFGSFTATKEEWMNMLGDGIVHHKEGNCIFI